MKGQSAIEYLVTYGWMLLSVAVVTGIVLPLIGGNQCNRVSTGIQTGSLSVENYALTEDNNVSLQIENSGPTELSIEEFEATVNNRTRNYTVSKNITPGGQRVASITALEQTEVCEEIKVEAVYAKGPLEGLTTSFELKGKFRFNNLSSPQPLTAVNANY